MTDGPRSGPPPPALGAAGPRRGLLSNASALISSRLVVAVLGWAGTILIVRVLTPVEWGQFSLVFTVLGLFSFMTSLGSSRIVLAELARAGPQAGRYAGSYVVLRLLLGAAAYASAVAFTIVVGYPPEVVAATALAGIVLIIAAAGAGLDIVFLSELRAGPVATGNVLGQLAQLGVTVLVAVTRPSLLLFLLPALAFDVIAAAWKAAKVRQVLPVQLRVDVAAWRAILVQAAPLAAGSAFTTIALSVDLVLLSKVDTFAAVGALAVADKFAMVVAFVPVALEPPLMALLVRSWPAEPAVFYRTVRHAMLLMSVSAGLVLVGFLPVATEVVSTLYGAEYGRAATAAQLSVVAGCLQFYSGTVLGSFVAMGRNQAFVWFSLAALAVTVATSALLVPAYSVVGAGYARVASAGIMLVVLVVLVRRQMTDRVLAARQHVAVAACALASLAVAAGLAAVTWWPVAAAGGVLVYLSSLHLLRVTGPEGLRSLAQDTSPGAT